LYLVLNKDQKFIKIQLLKSTNNYNIQTTLP